MVLRELVHVFENVKKKVLKIEPLNTTSYSAKIKGINEVVIEDDIVSVFYV